VCEISTQLSRIAVLVSAQWKSSVFELASWVERRGCVVQRAGQGDQKGFAGGRKAEYLYSRPAWARAALGRRVGLALGSLLLAREVLPKDRGCAPLLHSPASPLHARCDVSREGVGCWILRRHAASFTLNFTLTAVLLLRCPMAAAFITSDDAARSGTSEGAMGPRCPRPLILVASLAAPERFSTAQPTIENSVLAASCGDSWCRALLAAWNALDT
jgi:hypothetical protein